ncbi:MAG TPA: hypothetical protein EYH31_11495 [Anaerolineae bacterium]|nr:hypothetical protein [Anaerolineae bacterium]
MKFVASIATNPARIYRIRDSWKESGDPRNPLARIIVTPLFCRPGTLNAARELSEAGSQVYFDSGGYYVQQNKIGYHELYWELLQFYRANRWADWYVLPDYVPTSQDDEETVWRKVRETASFSRLFFLDLPDDLKPRAIAVVQGHTLAQIEYCLETYVALGIRYIGFGSFGTIGKNNEVNSLTKNNRILDIVQYLSRLAQRHGQRVHFFGIGAPATLALFHQLQAESFDSSTWMKSAGFGQVFFPLTRGFNVTYRKYVHGFQKSLSEDEFHWLKALTGHECRFCRSLAQLRESEHARRMHNLACVLDSVALLESGDEERIARIYQEGSPYYRNEYRKWQKLHVV